MRNIQLLALMLGLIVVNLPLSLSAASSNDNNYPQRVLLSCMSLQAATTDTSTTSCVDYIKGFLAGAVSTRYQYQLKESSGEFIDRAYRTRVGNQTSKKQPVELCIPANKSRAQLIEQIVDKTVKQLPATTDSLQLLHKHIYQALAAESSCKQQNSQQ